MGGVLEWAESYSGRSLRVGGVLGWAESYSGLSLKSRRSLSGRSVVVGLL